MHSRKYRDVEVCQERLPQGNEFSFSSKGGRTFPAGKKKNGINFNYPNCFAWANIKINLFFLSKLIFRGILRILNLL